MLKTKHVLSTFKGWHSEIESPENGCVAWYNPNTETRIYATPNYDDDGITPFAVNNGEDEMLVLSLHLNDDMSIEMQKTLYFETLKMILDNLHLFK